MYHLAYLVACFWLGSYYHSGQASKGYTLMGLAIERANREHSAINLGRVMDNLRITQLYPKNGEFRNCVAFWLKRMKHQRFSL